MTRLIDEDIPAGPVNTVDQILSDPHVQAREMVVETHHPLLGALPLVGSPLKLSSHPVKMLRPPPVLGQHTAEVLSETLGYSVDKLEQLRSEGVV
jgi:crotonobetainyl-CoA:carnitine CoA-transferase CaiB-like acyl-CoA transferase